MTQKNKNSIIERPPIVVVLGHVDHGKSTLLDYIRKTNTTEKETGGITQHISAYELIHTTKDGKERRITFLDTPGHKAFSKMRERGAHLADIAILVVSGEDGVKEQTIEVLKTIQESTIPYIVAITKMDKPTVDLERVKQDLASHEIFVEGYGGEVPVVPVSAKTGTGVSDLLDMILLVAELGELRGSKDTNATGFVVESHVDPREGTLATVIITDGLLKTGMYVVAGNALAPVRKIDAFLDHNAQEASFSSPVILTGFNTVPMVGMPLLSFESKKEAELFIRTEAEKTNPEASHLTQKSMGATGADTETFCIPIVIKADTTGSLEALENEIEKIPAENACYKVIHRGVGAIEEGDLKAASCDKNSIIIGLHVGVGNTSKQIATQQEITIKTSEIIYELIEWLGDELKKRTPKKVIESQIGSAKILRMFSKTKNKQVVGGKVLEGEIVVRGKVKIVRRGVLIDEGIVLELQQQKVKTGKVTEGNEFGALIESKHDIAQGDTLEAIALIEK